MAKVKRTSSSKTEKAPKKSGKGRKKGKLPIEVSFPEEPDELSNDLRDYSILVHGEKKIGKTSLFAQEEGAFFLEFDPKQKALAIKQRQMPDWRTFLAYLAEMEKLAKAGKLPYKTVIVDGVDIMYHLCFSWKCTQLGIAHPHDENDYGKSWGAIREEFTLGIRRLLGLNLYDIATRFITHSTWKEIKTRGGPKIDKLVPLLTSQAEEVVTGLVDVWAAYCYDGTGRSLVIVGDEEIGAGHRIDHKFRTLDDEAVTEIPMGNSPKEAYANLLTAFDNEQEHPNCETRKPKRTKARTKVKTKKK